LTFWALPAAAEIEGTYPAIRGAIESYEAAHPGHTLTIPALLAQLPAEYRRNFSLVYFSQSIQRASYQDPRVVMFGRDGQTIITFNGASDQNGFDELELAIRDPETHAVDYRFISFPPNDSGDGQADFSEANPQRCASCHGAPGRHIWGRAPSWPGVYGSVDDALEPTAEEAEEFVRFRDQAPLHSRYRSLLFDACADSSYSPYRSGTADSLACRPNSRLESYIRQTNN
jgi:hypothetical protein